MRRAAVPSFSAAFIPSWEIALRYVDSTLAQQAGDRLTDWLSRGLTTASRFTLRTGFFTARAIGLMQDSLEGLLGRGGELLAVVGGDVLQCDIAALRVLLDLSRHFPEQAQVFVVAEPALQNAKTYHLQHADGRCTAWVGSNNFTVGGFATNLEAAIIVDSEDDNPTIVDQVRTATFAATEHPAAYPLDQAVLHQLERRVREARLAPPGTAPARPSPLIVDHCHLLLDRLDRAGSADPSPPAHAAVPSAWQVLPTGFGDLDVALAGGLRPGTVSVIASRPGAGRSTFVLNVLTKAAATQRAASCMYSFEFTDDEAVLRIASATARIRLLDLRNGRLDDRQWSTLAETLGGLADAPLFLDCRQPPHLDALCSTITAAVARDGLDLVAVDPASLVQAGPRIDPHESHMAEVLRRLKQLAMQLRIHIVTTTELERPSQSTGGHLGSRDLPPQLTDLKDQDAVMETADVVVLLHRPDTDERDHRRAGEADLLIVKNRYGLPGKVTIAHQLHYARFTTKAAPPPPPPPPAGTPPSAARQSPPARLPEAPSPTDSASSAEERLIAVGDTEVVLRSAGVGDPPVILLGRADPAEDEWAALLTGLEDVGRIISYRRPRRGGPDPLTSSLADGRSRIAPVVTQLHGLLTAARIARPAVLVASSIGAWVADQYAARRPRDVAGMVLIDPAALIPWPDLDPPPPQIDGNNGETGYLPRLATDCYAELARPSVAHPRRTVVVSSTDGRWHRRPPRAEDGTWDPRTLAEMDRLWPGYQLEWVRRLNAHHVTATDAGHLVHRDQPDLVARIVTDIVHAARAGQAVRLNQRELAKRGGRLAAKR